MTRKLKPIDVPLDKDVVEGILALPVEDPHGELTTVGRTVALAAQLLESANVAIEKNELCSIVADSLMRDQKRRGTPSIRVKPDCTVVLHISYSGDEEGGDDDMPARQPTQLPTLDELRARAMDKGVDISDLGRQKRAILSRLEGDLGEGAIR